MLYLCSYAYTVVVAEWKPKEPPKGTAAFDPTVGQQGRRDSTVGVELKKDLADAGAFGYKTEDRYAGIPRETQSGVHRTQSMMEARRIRDEQGRSVGLRSPAVVRASREFKADRSHVHDSPPPPEGADSATIADSLLTEGQIGEYLRALSVKKDPIASAHAVGVDPQIMREKRERDPIFMKRCEDALLNERRYVQYMKSSDWRIRPRTDPNGRLIHPTLEVLEEMWPQIAASIAEFGNFSIAADSVGTSASKIKNRMILDTDFRNLIEDALLTFSAKIEQEALRRAVDGYDVPVFGGRFKDEIVGYERKYSDSLMSMMLKRNDPSYRDKQTIEVQKQTTIRHEVDFGALPKEMRGNLKDMLQKMVAARQAGTLVQSDSQSIPDSQTLDAQCVEVTVEDGDEGNQGSSFLSPDLRENPS